MTDVVERLVFPVLQSLEAEEAAQVARRRLRLMASAPTLFSHEAIQHIESIVAKVLSPSKLKHGAPVALAARTLVATTLGALLWWAQEGDEVTALEATRLAFAALADAEPRLKR
jgi:hypothetical protein